MTSAQKTSGTIPAISVRATTHLKWNKVLQPSHSIMS